MVFSCCYIKNRKGKMIQIQHRYSLFVLVAVATFIPIGAVCTAQTAENTGVSESVIELQKCTVLIFAQVEEAKKRLTTKDDFIKSLSPFDRSARLKTDKFVSEEEFLKYIAEQVRPWKIDDRTNITAMFESVAGDLKDFDLNFPPKILLIKTTGREEGGAAYCRSNAIIIPQSMLVQRNVGLETILIQELFHILSANDSKFKEALYELINFKKCDDIELPEKIRDIKITNPDGVKNDHYVEVQYKDDIIQMVPVIYSSVPKYDVAKGSEFFRYLKINLLAIEKAGDRWRYKRDSNGEPVLLELLDVPDYFNKIGFNTNYVFHPEEILAKNFVLMVKGTQPVKSEWVIEGMRKLLQRDSDEIPGQEQRK
jgi:hypothetical protein